MSLQSHQLDPGALNEDGGRLALAHPDGGPRVHVVDRLAGVNGSYAVVQDAEGSPFLTLVGVGDLAEFDVSDDTDDTVPEQDPDRLNEGEPGNREPEPSDDDGRDEFDRLTGADLDDALDNAGIDPSSGGSRADGSLNAAERRQALREHNAANDGGS